MANPRELAEQAFALLQNALRDSEARASDLDAQLKRKKAPKNQLEESVEVLAHRLETVEAERVHWQQAASHLEEIAEAERAKVAQLKKKLEIAESGPEKLTKKEVNFWRAKAEDIDTETQEYKTRLQALRQELMERDALIDGLRDAQQNGSAADVAATAAGEAPAAQFVDLSGEVEALRQQLEERELRIGNLQVELDELRDTPAPTAEPTLETLAQIDAFRRQIASFEQALTEAHTARAALKGELAQAHAELSEQQRVGREAQANVERAHGTLSERDHRLVELTAEVEHLHLQLEQRDQQLRSAAADRDERLAALGRDLDSLRERAESHARDATHAVAEREQLREALRGAQQRFEHVKAELDSLRGALTAHEHSAREAATAARNLETALADRDRQLAQRDEALAGRNREIAQRDEDVANRDRQLAQRSEDLASRDRQLAQRDAELASRDQGLAERDRRIDELDRSTAAQQRAAAEQLAERDRRIDDLDRIAAVQQQAAAEQTADLDRELANLRPQLTSLHELLAERDQELDRIREDVQTRELELAERQEQLASLSAQLEHARTDAQASHRELNSLRDTLLGTNRDLDQLRVHKHRLEDELSNVLTRADIASADAAEKGAELERAVAARAELERQRDETREQMAGLEAELKDEKDNAENLTELVNERREHIQKLQEQVEESEERYEEAKWRLGKAQHFERIVKRRKGLIAALLATLRTKMKANVALKAGLDGLRTYKAAAEVNQQKLLQRIDALKGELKDAEETVERHQGTPQAKEELAETQSHTTSLEMRLNAQAELIQQLEADLKVARTMQKSGDEKNQEIERLHKELDTKNQAIANLQTDADERERRLAKLRGSESETMRLKAVSEKDRSSIDALEREIAQLRDTLSRQSADGNATGAAPGLELDTMLKEREQTVNRLMGTIKEHEATIRKLTESADSWKRKYNFLATDSPDAYKTAGEK